jgi:hypothetical protein
VLREVSPFRWITNGCDRFLAPVSFGKETGAEGVVAVLGTLSAVPRCHLCAALPLVACTSGVQLGGGEAGFCCNFRAACVPLWRVASRVRRAVPLWRVASRWSGGLCHFGGWLLAGQAGNSKNQKLNIKSHLRVATKLPGGNPHPAMAQDALRVCCKTGRLGS